MSGNIDPMTYFGMTQDPKGMNQIRSGFNPQNFMTGRTTPVQNTIQNTDT
jgi:hypothetical protein